MTIDISSIYADLLPITHAAGADVDEDFLEGFADSFEGSESEFLSFVRANISKWYRTLESPPEWLQEPDWQYFEGRPMVFVGAIDRDPGASGLHDDARFFVFWDPETGVTETVIQLS